MSQKLPYKQTELIVFGFMKNIQQLFPFQTNPYYNIPTDIARITLLYLSNYFSNDSVYKWKITDKQMVHTMLNAKCGDKFMSEQFKMARLNWRLEIYPNGDKMDVYGYFVIHLRLLSLPSIVDKIEFHRIFRVMENMTGSPYICTISKGEYEYWTTKCPLKELIDMKCKTITVQIEIQINKLILKETISNIENININTNDTVDIAMNQQLIYKAEGKAMDIIKNSMNRKEMCGDVVNNMWCFSLNPNGMTQLYKGYVDPFITLCRLPLNVTEIYIKYKIQCVETQDKFEEDVDLTVEWCGSLRIPNFIKLLEIQHLDSITFIADIEILEMEKETNSLVICDDTQMTYLLGKE